MSLPMFARGDGVFHSKRGPGLIEALEDDVARVRFRDGSVSQFSLADLAKDAAKLDNAGFTFLDLRKQITAELRS
jgi:hypothetical protein